MSSSFLPSSGTPNGDENWSPGTTNGGAVAGPSGIGPKDQLGGTDDRPSPPLLLLPP